MKIRPQGGALIRVAIYLTALLVVVFLLRHREALIPAYGLAVTEVRRADRWGALTAADGERLLIVTVQLKISADEPPRLKPGLFRLLDDEGREHHPSPLSPLFQDQPVADEQGLVEGYLVFQLSSITEGKSLSFYPEGEDHGADYQSENTGPKGGPGGGFPWADRHGEPGRHPQPR